MAELHLLSPAGFRASGVYAGIKSRQSPDVGLLLCDASASAAALFTTNKVMAAPVTLARQHILTGQLRGAVVNSGNANACTGAQGDHDAKQMCDLAAAVVGCKRTEIVPASTGIIGHFLPMEKVQQGISEAGKFLGNSEEHALLFADTILTTDTRRKVAAAEFKVNKQPVTIAGVCKGSGMIGPRLAAANAKHATMLAYLTTDAKLAPPLLQRLLKTASDSSFNAVTIDDHTSTNDMALLLASGASGISIRGGKDLESFKKALDEVCRSLAYQIASDGEGATKVVVVNVRKAASATEAMAMARAIANSPLVKCAMNGNDPNWGRIISAAGIANARFEPNKAHLTLQGATVFSRGRPAEFDRQALSSALTFHEVQVVLTCNLGKHEATCWTCDLSKDYVTINADYHT
jgi:glutamate N-acetyltransferase / amino-acid N-acetyltransferase